MSNGLSIISDLDLSKQSWSWLYLSQGFAHPSICPRPGEDDKYVLVPGVRWQPRRGFHCHSATSRRGGRNLFEEDFTLFNFEDSFQNQSILFKALSLKKKLLACSNLKACSTWETCLCWSFTILILIYMIFLEDFSQSKYSCLQSGKLSWRLNYLLEKRYDILYF